MFQLRFRRYCYEGRAKVGDGEGTDYEVTETAQVRDWQEQVVRL